MEKITDEELRALLMKNSQTQIELEEPVMEQEELEVEQEEPINVSVEELTGTEDYKDQLEGNIDFNIIPEEISGEDDEPQITNEIIEQRNSLTIGLTPEDIQDLFDYIAGKKEKPAFVDRFMADAEGRLREMTSIMTLVQLSQLPKITALRDQALERLFSPTNLYDMDSKTLSAMVSSLSKDIFSTLSISIDNIQTISQFGTLNNDYRKILDGILMLPKDKLDQVAEYIYKETPEKE